MKSPSPSPWSRRLVWIAALAGSGLIAGLGAYALLNDATDSEDGDTTAPVATVETGATTASADGSDASTTGSDSGATGSDSGAAGSDSAAAEPDSSTAEPDSSTAGPLTVGPLTVMQQRLDGQDGSELEYFCFAGRDAAAASDGETGRVVFELAVQDSGNARLIGSSPSYVYGGSAKGNAEGALTFGIAEFLRDPGPRQVSLAVQLTDDALVLPEELTAERVSCRDISEEIDVLYDALPGDPADFAPDIPIIEIAADQTLTPEGLGPIRVGMTVSELSAELGAPIEFDTIGLREPGECAVTTTLVATGVYMLVELISADDAIIRRVSVLDDRWATESGIRVGTNERQVLDTFNDRLSVRPHVYAKDGAYLTINPDDINEVNTVEFWTEFDQVVEIHVGDGGWVSNAEACA